MQKYWTAQERTHSSTMLLLVKRLRRWGRASIGLRIGSPRQTTTFVIRTALEEVGIEFIYADGVRRRTEEVSVYRGVLGRKNFLMSFTKWPESGKRHRTYRHTGRKPNKLRRSYSSVQDDRKNTTSFVKCLLTFPINPVLESTQIEWRLISRNYIDPMPICICGDIYAMISGTKGEDIRIVTMRSLGAVQASRNQFLSICDKATSMMPAKQKAGNERLLASA